MLRIASVLILSLMLLFSCETTSGGRSFSRDEAVNALESLSADMVDIAAGKRIAESTVAGSLPVSYRNYASYVPLYGTLASEYCQSVADILTSLLPEVYSRLSDAIPDIINDNPESLIEGDTAVADAAIAAGGDIYADVVESASGRFAEAFSPSHSVFEDIRQAYINLETVGYNADIAEAEPISADVLAEILRQEAESILRDAEKQVRNSPESLSDPVYSIFWSR